MTSLATVTIVLFALSAEATDNDLTGLVVDQEGRSVAGANVFIYTAKPRGGVGVLCPSCYADCAKETTTGADGQFSIEALDSELLFQLLVVAEEYKPVFVKEADPRAEPLSAKLELLPEGLDEHNLLRGRVVDKRGKPIAGATVEPFGIKTAERRWWGRMTGVDPLAVANLDGEFLIVSKEADVALDLEVSAAGHTTRKFELLSLSAEEPHELELGDGVLLTGTLIADGKPAEGITMGVVQADRSHRSFVGESRIQTNQRGRFEFANVVPEDEVHIYTKMKDSVRLGTLQVRIIMTGKDGSSREVGELPLEPTHRLAGKIILTDGKPIPVKTRLLAGREYAWDTLRVALGADGAFSLEGIPTEPITFTTRIPGYRLANKRNRLQQIRSGAVALFVDRDRLDLEIFYEPEPAKP
jgi:hypothetical protein